MNTLASAVRHLVVISALVLTYPLSAAENPIHTPATRDVVNPLYQGRTDAASLAPLQAWARQRCADGTCTAETMQRELQVVLNDIHENAMRGHRILLEDIKAARSARETLLKEIGATQAGGQPVRALADRIGKLPAIPTRAWGDPHVDQITASSAQRTSSSSATSSTSSTTTTTTKTGRTITASSSQAASATETDLNGVAEKLNTELATLTTLAQQTQADMQKAAQLMQQATAELARQSKAAHDIAMNAIRNMKG